MTDSRIEDQINRFNLAVGRFEASIASLESESFPERLNGWSPRDIVAHLVGWNSHVIEGAEQIQRGELPFYDIDPGENYSNVNEALVRAISATDREVLIEELRSSANGLENYLRSVAPEAWARDYGVRHHGARVTIRETVEELIDDYDHHRRQVEAWKKSK